MQTKKLRLTLKSNAGFSLISGLALIFFNSSIAQLMQISNAKTLVFIGIGLLLFSAIVYREAVRSEVLPKQVWLIIWQDWAWVLGTVVIIATGAFEISAAGYVIMSIVALMVADFAVLQRWYLK